VIVMLAVAHADAQRLHVDARGDHQGREAVAAVVERDCWRSAEAGRDSLERFNKEIGRRTDVVGIFPTIAR
jgi:hypothetical protein